MLTNRTYLPPSEPGAQATGISSVLLGSPLSAALILATVAAASAQQSGPSALSAVLDPLTRYLHITYPVPADAPTEVVVLCSWSPPGKNEWRPAKVTPFLSETALNLVRDDEWRPWVLQGRILERRAAGLHRTVIFNPYPEAQPNGRVDADFRIQIQSPDGKDLITHSLRLQADNTDVVNIEDWSAVLQKNALTNEPEPKDRKWSWRTGLEPSAGVTLGHALYGKSPAGLPLPQLSYPLNLRGPHALFICTVPATGIRLRLTGDERADTLSSRHPCEEVLWRWTRMDRQNLVLAQPHTYTGYTPAHIDYVKLVPLSKELLDKLESQFGGPPDKLIAGYWEPYSWAFAEDIQTPLQHREPLIAFADARIGIVDTQIGRFGMKVVYESQLTDRLLYSTIGDPVAGDATPTTDNVGRMQQFTTTLDTELRCARDLGFQLHANFGAGNSYLGTPLQGDFSKKHPDWMRGSALRFEVPEVRQYALSLYREALEIGAPGVSIDFCRYPETVDNPDAANTFLRDLRALTDEFAKARNKPVPILVRFPGTGVRRCEFFDYTTWARQGWVDYLCPSNIQGRHMHIDIAPYLAVVKNTNCKLLPAFDGLTWGLPLPGPFLWRVARLYEAGVPGLYVYQADARILGHPADRRCMRLLASSQAVRNWWEDDRQIRPRCSKGIYLSIPEAPDGAYHSYERLRVWIDGIEMGPLEFHLDEKLIHRCDGPPYHLGSEDYSADRIIPPGPHQLRIRAKDADAWLEQTFTIQGAN